MTGLREQTNPTKRQQAVIEAAEGFMENIMMRYDPSHDKHHVYRVRKTALAIARSEIISQLHPDLFVVEIAALLHDVLDKKYVSIEDATSNRILIDFFESPKVKSNLDLIASGQAQLIIRIIENVSWTTEKMLVSSGGITDWHRNCIELHCVQDADRLDAIGAFGIMRCAAFSAIKNRPLYVAPGGPDSDESAKGHFHDKLFHIRDRLKTDAGRKLAEHRHQLMVDFVNAVEAEADTVI